MIRLFKKYWDIISGVATGLLFSALVGFELKTVQLYYSIVISILVSIGFFRLIKQEASKRGRKKNERKNNIIDSIVDGQKPLASIKLAQEPLKTAESMGKILLNMIRGIGKIMKKLKTFFSKFKGYMLTIALAILTLVEMCSGSINALFGGQLTINGIAVLPVITLACTVVVGLISNGFTKEQQEKIKALFSKSSINEMVLEEIKKTIKEKTAQLTQFNKALATLEHELENYESELEILNNTLQAKKEMSNMVPQLATAEDVQLAANEVVACQSKIAAKKADIEKTKATVDSLTTTINALKSQL